MNTLEKAKILGRAGHYDSCGPKMCEVNVKSGLGGIYYAKAEHKTCRIFKTVMSNSCKFDCGYCGNTVCKKKVKYDPRELANLFFHLHKKLDVTGLFLSSGIHGDADKVTEEMIEAVRIVRKEKRFKGYVHFKVLPGTSLDLVKRAAELSNRMSINIEAPNSSVLREMAGCKDFKNDIMKRQRWIKKAKGNQATQIILNKLGNDKEVLKMSDYEYKEMDLKRVYYSAFRPVKGTRMENEEAGSILRERRLYNTDFLLRCYGYKVKEFNSIMDDGMLPREDPKLALARETFDGAVDVKEAEYEELIRVPGIGPKTACNIIANRSRIRKFGDLDRIGVAINRAKPFISVCGARQSVLEEF